MSHRLQGSRFEFKYIIDEHRARAMVPFLRCHLELDEHADPRKGSQYALHTLYLDSPDYCLYRGTTQGHKNRFKLRIRCYDELPQSPVFFEIKRRQGDVIIKRRAAVRRSALKRLLIGQWPRRKDLASADDGAWAALDKFCSLRDTIHARGKIFVSYTREAYVTPGDYAVRVTFDRNLQAHRYDGVFALGGCESRALMDGEVILELKFTDRFPIWMCELVRSFDLERTSMAKYITCVLAMPDRQLRLVPAHGSRIEVPFA